MLDFIGLFPHFFVALGRCKAQLMAAGGEAHVGIVLSEQYAILGARGEHAVRFVNSFGHEVVDQHTDVCLVPSQGEWLTSAAVDGGIDACNDALSRCFLIAGGAVHLSGEEEVFHHFRLQCMSQLCGVEVVVFDCIARPIDLHVAQCRDLSQGVDLYVDR